MPEDLDLGNPLNVFNNAVRKARAVEVSAHFEMEDTQKLIEIVDQADKGMIGTEDAKNKITAIINASSSVQANIDPDASYKYRATMANYGSRMVEYIAKKEIEKNQVANTFKVQQSYQNTLGVLAKALESPLGINPATNAEWEIGDYLNASIQNFIGNTQALLGQAEAAKYGARMKSDMENIMMGAVRKELIKPQYFNNSIETLNQIAAGNIPNVKQIGGYFAVNNPKALLEIQRDFRQMVVDRRQQRIEDEAKDKSERELQTNDLLIELWAGNPSKQRERQITLEVSKLRTLSFSQMKQLLDKDNNGADIYSISNIETRILNNDITTTAELLDAVGQVGANGQQYGKLFGVLSDLQNKGAKAEALKRANRFAGVPDDLSQFTDDAQRARIAKRDRVIEIRDELATEWMKVNPNEIVPWIQLQRQAETQYDTVDRKNIKKNNAREALSDFVKRQNLRDEREGKDIRLGDGFVINEDTNLDDLIAAGKIDPGKRAFLQSEINKLREVSE
jgi:hypothetical protein